MDQVVLCTIGARGPFTANRMLPWKGLAVILALMVVSTSADMDYTCVPGATSRGVTIPRGTVTLEVGSDLEIFCHLNPNSERNRGKNSSSLYFFRNSDLLGPPEVQIVNKTTIRLNLTNLALSKDLYTCKLKEDLEQSMTGVCTTKVVAGFPPYEVSDFHCISYNWQSLACSWKKPNNTIDTTYALTAYRYVGKNARLAYQCPVRTEETCFWNLTTDPQYNQILPNLYFVLNGTNELNRTGIKKYYSFKHWSIVIPKPPQNLRKRVHHGGAEITWDIPYPLQTFPPGLVHVVKYRSSRNATNMWDYVDTSGLDKKNKTNTVHVPLPFANTVYNISVQMRSADAEQEDHMLSEPAIITLKSESSLPDTSPTTDIGSFETVGRLQSRDIYVYWQQIPETSQNGDDFHYTVTEVYRNGILDSVTPNRVTNAYAAFTNMTYESYKFVIVSENKMGKSSQSSEVFVPGRSDMIGHPKSFTKIDYTRGHYVLEWKPPKKDDRLVTNYTVYWCSSRIERPYQCEGYLDWKTVSRDTLTVNITLNQTERYQFAVAANSKYGSSGMSWSSCTIIYNKVVDKIRDVEINGTGENEISVAWRLDCSERIGIITGYRLYYCMYNGSTNCTGMCVGPEYNLTIHETERSGHVLRDLKPYTKYMIQVSAITRAGEGRQSDPVCNSTLATAPSTAPYDVKIGNITATSFVVSWLPPPDLNGILDHFEVEYNDETVNVQPSDLGDGVYSTVLENLTGYTNYSVRVKACTVKCSVASDPAVITTAIGIPGKMNPPKVAWTNKTAIAVTWEKPSVPGGPIDAFEISATSYGKDDTNETGTDRSPGDRYVAFYDVQDCFSENGPQTLSFMIRAVNNLSQTELKGDWSPEVEWHCFSEGYAPKYILYVAIAITIVIFSVLTVICCLKKSWRACLEIRTIPVKLPPGLVQPEMSLGAYADYKTSFVPPRDPEQHFDTGLFYNRLNSATSDDDRERHLSGDTGSSLCAVDEELLIQKSGGSSCRNPSGDSSVCLSGHDSVSSSMTTGTHLSTDSGSEHPPSPDNVFPDNLWNSGQLPVATSSLRLRNPPNIDDCAAPFGTGGGGYTRMNYIVPGVTMLGHASSTPNLDQLLGGPEGGGGGYVTASFLPHQQPRPSAPYISMPSKEMGIREGISEPSLDQLECAFIVPQRNNTDNGYVLHSSVTNVPALTQARGYVAVGQLPETPVSYCKVGTDTAISLPTIGTAEVESSRDLTSLPNCEFQIQPSLNGYVTCPSEARLSKLPNCADALSTESQYVKLEDVS